MAEQQELYEYLAHVRQEIDGTWSTHALEDHLAETARIAADFAAEFGASDWAWLAGRWHDQGKFSPQFQSYLKHESGFDPEAHVEGGGRVDHSTAGAIHACEQLGPYGRLLAYLIAGHHAGLADWEAGDSGNAALRIRLASGEKRRSVPDDVIARYRLLPERKPTSTPRGGPPGLALWLRMLYSCLTDADFLDTEAFMDRGKGLSRGLFADLSALRERFNEYLDRMTAVAAQTQVNRIRADILRQCRQKADSPAGFFSLSVPTGGGKTLSAMAFALDHALRNRQRRIIYVIPYTSIIEQTAEIFCGIFGDNVVEHHANLDPDRESAQSRLATENWDAPIIVTTNVQFFESLFAARSSRCRKLHNIVGSVVVLDEAQLLPPEFLQPIADTMNLLVAHYGVSFVLSTATQPALGSFTSPDDSRFRGIDQVKEIIEDPNALHGALERVRVTLPTDLNAACDWDSLAERLCQHPSVLCIVNRRQDARELHRRMPAGTFHLSALMCGEHRSVVIREIRQRLRAGEAVRVVSTQLVEAGVDLDFPVVYRAISGLDSIAQAAGRCNREGKLERGEVVLFVPPTAAPPGLLRQAAQITVDLLSQTPDASPLSREIGRRFFEHLYVRAPSLDKQQIVELLTRDARDAKIQFRSAADKFRLIDDDANQTILAHYGDCEVLCGKLAKDGPERWLMRKLQRYSVSIPKRQFAQMEQQGDVYEVRPGIWMQTAATLYDKTLGVIYGGDIAPDQLVG